MQLEIPFEYRALNGKILVSVTPNNDPRRWGYAVLGGDDFPLQAPIGFPVCAAHVQYSGEGYHSAMGWVQSIRYTEGQSKNMMFVDLPPLLEDSNCPFAFWGIAPTLFDAPCALSDDHTKRANIDWRADSFLVAARDGVMSKNLELIRNFSWGYKTDSTGEVEIVGPKPEELSEWENFADLFQQRFPNWRIN